MYNTKQKIYDDFICIASSCPESCCKGWQIMIDDESIKKYEILSDKDERVCASVNFSESCFKQDSKRCMFLDGDELCYLQKNYGEEMLCETCRRYPRHIEEFENVREYSLSLSCPQAAKMMLLNDAPMEFVSWNDENSEEYEEFDYLLYEQLLDTREIIFSVAQNRKLSLKERLQMIYDTGVKLQNLLDEGELFEMTAAASDISSELRSSFDSNKSLFSLIPDETEKRLFSVLFEMEQLHDDWDTVLNMVWEDIFIEKNSFDKELFEKYSSAGEQILMFFLYTYYCGAVYDCCIHSKTCLAVYSVKWIFYIAMSLKKHEPGDDFTALLIRASYKYAREIEHSDLNLNLFEQFFMDELDKSDN